MRPLRVLILDSSPGEAARMLFALERAGFAPSSRRVESEDELREALAEPPWALVLSAPTLPALDTLAALALCRAIDPETPFVVIADQIGDEPSLALLHAGATNCVLRERLDRLGALAARALLDAEKARAERRTSYLAAIVEGAEDAIFSKTLEGRVMSWNAAAERLFGFTAAEVLDGPASFHVPADRRDEHALLVDRVRRGERVAHFETVRLHKDGTPIEVTLAVSPVRDAGGRLIGVSTVLRDIRDRRRAEAEAAAILEDLRLRDRAIQALRQGILITDSSLPDNLIVYASPGFSTLTGYSLAETLGKNCRFLQGEETDRAAVLQVRRAIAAGEPCTVELLNYRKDGTTFWNELSISPVRDADGRLTHMVGVQTDVTGRRAIEEQLCQSQKMDGMGQLAGGMAHDLNNLLTIINGSAELLLEDLSLGDAQCELVQEIRAAGERSALLTRQLLAFARKQVLAPRVLDLNAVVTESLSMLQRLIGEDLHLSTTLAPDLGLVRADPGQLQQLLVNLVVNARDAMPDGGHVRVETRRALLDDAQARLHPGAVAGPYAVLLVSDSGSGMSEEVKRRAFEPFFTTKARGKGTGLGLSVVHGVVSQAGGFLEIFSEPGAGTIVAAHLPQVAASAPDEAPSPQRAVLERGSETILLVEDDAGVRSFTQRVLLMLGYQVIAARSGTEALALLDAHHGAVDLLVTDVVMPGMNGRQLAEAVVARHPTVHVLFVSGYTDDAIVRRGVLQDEVSFLAKPFSAVALASKLRALLDPPSSPAG
jgi:PAS domain S-box-containing protein